MSCSKSTTHRATNLRSFGDKTAHDNVTAAITRRKEYIAMPMAYSKEVKISILTPFLVAIYHALTLKICRNLEW